MSTITVPLAPRLTRLGRGRGRDAVATDAASEQASDASMTALQGDESEALVEQAAQSVRKAAGLVAVSLLVAVVVGGAAVALSKSWKSSKAPKS
ncbi:MAG TPA: hypothetical protein VHI51_05210 [Ktedonobacterales bacterium]|jgi:hypothetical protein|nr:hypothetical protein [Ktedonobacterales bacterium]